MFSQDILYQKLVQGKTDLSIYYVTLSQEFYMYLFNSPPMK